MLYVQKIKWLLEELKQASSQEIAGTQIVAFDFDIDAFSKDQKDDLPYLFAVLPQVGIVGNKDSLTYKNEFVLFVGYKINTKENIYDQWMTKMETLQKIMNDIVVFIIEKQTSEACGFYKNIVLDGTIEAFKLNQMTYLALPLHLKSDIK